MSSFDNPNFNEDAPHNTFKYTVEFKSYGENMTMQDVIRLISVVQNCDKNDMPCNKKESWVPKLTGFTWKKKANSEAFCCICSEEYKESSVVFETQCGHVFHKQCLRNWFKQSVDPSFISSCPYCRQHVPVKYEYNKQYCVLGSYKVNCNGDVYLNRSLHARGRVHNNRTAGNFNVRARR